MVNKYGGRKTALGVDIVPVILVDHKFYMACSGIEEGSPQL
jgi:hypothetical protein